MKRTGLLGSACGAAVLVCLAAIWLSTNPSGHVMNIATLAVVVLLILPRWRVAVIGGLAVAVMALSRTYLNVHWLTDTLAGALLGAAIPILLMAAFRFGEKAWGPSSVRLR